MTETYEELKVWYEKESGMKITDEEAKEALQNLMGFFEILARWEAKRQGDLNPEPEAKQADKE